MVRVRAWFPRVSVAVRSILRAAAIGLVVVLCIVAAGLVLDAVQLAAPEPNVYCHSQHVGAVDFSSSYGSSCVWQDAAPSPGPPATATITEVGNDEFRATISVPVDTTQDWVARVRAGEAAADPDGFVSAVLGFAVVSQGGFNWSAPAISTGDARTPPTLTVTGQRDPHGPSIGGGEPVTVEVYLRSGGAISVEAKTRVISGVRGATITSASDRSATVWAGDSSDSVEFDLVSPGPRDAGSGPVQALDDTSIMAALRDIAVFDGGLLLSAAAWIILLLFAQLQRPRQWATAPAWQRTRTVITAGVVAALVIEASFAASTLDYRFRDLAQEHFPEVIGQIWPGAGYSLGVPGIEIMVMAAAITLAAALYRRSRSRPAGRLLGRIIVPVVVLVLAASAYIWYAQQVASDSPTVFDHQTSPLLPFVPVAAFAVLLLIAAILRTVAPAWFPLAGTSAIGVLLSCLALIHAGQGWVPEAVRWGGVVIATVAAIACLVVMCLYPAGAVRPPRLWVFVGAVAGAALAVTSLRPFGGQDEVGWSNLSALLWGLISLLGLAFVGATVLFLRAIGTTPVVRPGELFAQRRLALVLGVILLLGPYSIGERHGIIEIVVACALAVLLLPRSIVRPASRALTQASEHQRQAVTNALAAGDARRILPAYQKALREDVAAGKIELSVLRAKMSKMEDASRTESGGRDTHLLAFTGLSAENPWQRATWGAGAGALIGLPWTILALASTLRLGSVPKLPLEWLAAFAPAALVWAGIGFFFGYFFPLIRGRSGLQKGLWLATAVALADLARVLLPAGSPDWNAQVLSIVQVYAFALSLGLAADNTVLQRSGYSWRRLIDVHNLGGITLWGSSVAVAVATGVTSIIVSGLQPFLLDVFTPEPPKPPAVTTTTAP